MGAWCFKAPEAAHPPGVRRRASKTSIQGGSIKQRVQIGIQNWRNPDTRTWDEKEAVAKGFLDSLLITNDDLWEVS